MISSDFIFKFTNVIVSFFLTKLLTLDIFLSTVVRAVLVTKLVILSILFLTPFVLALRAVVVANLVIPGILSSVFLILSISFLMTSFLLHHLVYLNQQEQVLIYQHVIYLLYFSNCLN